MRDAYYQLQIIHANRGTTRYLYVRMPEQGLKVKEARKIAERIIKTCDKLEGKKREATK